MLRLFVIGVSIRTTTRAAVPFPPIPIRSVEERPVSHLFMRLINRDLRQIPQTKQFGIYPEWAPAEWCVSDLRGRIGNC